MIKGFLPQITGQAIVSGTCVYMGSSIFSVIVTRICRLLLLIHVL